jgi:hypothetical protein
LPWISQGFRLDSRAEFILRVKMDVGLLSTTMQMFIQTNEDGIVNTNKGKPGARSPNFHDGRKKKV